MNLIGKSREQIGRATAGLSADELRDLVHVLATLEPRYSARTLAVLYEMDRRTIVADIRDGKFGGEYLQRAENQLRVTAAGVLYWESHFRVKVPLNGNGSRLELGCARQ